MIGARMMKAMMKKIKTGMSRRMIVVNQASSRGVLSTTKQSPDRY
jgi:hypothetical protein